MKKPKIMGFYRVVRRPLFLKLLIFVFLIFLSDYVIYSCRYGGDICLDGAVIPGVSRLAKITCAGVVLSVEQRRRLEPSE